MLTSLSGDLVFFHGLGNNILVLNSMKAINDLLEKRGSIYSDRPSFTVVGDLMGLGQVRREPVQAGRQVSESC